MDKDEISRMNVFQSQLKELSNSFNALIEDTKNVTKKEVSSISQMLIQSNKEIMSDVEQSIEDKVKMLIASANDAGGRDNITVVIANLRTNARGNAHVEDFEYSNKITKNKKFNICPILSGICGFIIGIVISQMYNMYKADCKLEHPIHSNIDMQLDNSEFGSHSTAIDDSTFLFTPELIKNDHRIAVDSLSHKKESVATQE